MEILRYPHSSYAAHGLTDMDGNTNSSPMKQLQGLQYCKQPLFTLPAANAHDVAQ